MTDTRLTVQERKAYRKQLRGLITRLSNVVAQLEAEGLRPRDGDQAADPNHAYEADRAVREAEGEVARTLLVPEEQILAEATAALGRLLDGTFGICERCGHAITKPRLEVLPYSRTCIRCASETERRNRDRSLK